MCVQKGKHLFNVSYIVFVKTSLKLSSKHEGLQWIKKAIWEWSILQNSQDRILLFIADQFSHINNKNH